MSPVLPPPEEDGELVNSGLQLPKFLNDRLKEIAAQRGKSRNWVAKHFLLWALKQYEQEEGSVASASAPSAAPASNPSESASAGGARSRRPKK
ncbi:hypothetical protein G4177_06320 [Corallococcus sp. ZKHCc1 1396]|uniref:CopG family transcriptional regulator n=1 Tax=Corallococcus soli TaxID=2710757 RepID=A0ABR9PIN5_9BACT|nr:hypothetical protein [Corallococcus soli]MBE4747793.1 hypothetical protein [Corallococcus soli]